MVGAARVTRFWSLPVSVVMLGLLITAGFTWATRAAFEENEDRLTRERTSDVAAVLTAAVPSIEGPLTISAELVEVESDPELFRRVMGTQVGPEQRFVSASVWRADGTDPLVVIGETPRLASEPPEAIRRFLERSVATDLMTVLDLANVGSSPRLGYGFSAPGGSAEFVIYAEQNLPPDRRSQVADDEAFSDLEFALYLDTPERSGTLLLASTDALPFEGRRAEKAATFGDSELRIVVSPAGTLSGALLSRLSGAVLLVGLALTGAAAALTATLQRRRRVAEALADENAGLYAEQRAASLTLQQSLLPRELQDVPGLEVVARYNPGESGTEVGGDWYDVIEAEGTTTLVVGDVSGRGLAAASVMAAVRHSVRAYAHQGDQPDVILRKVNRRHAIDLDGHFVTVLCLQLDAEAGDLSIASAGHPPPILVSDDASRLLVSPVGPPIGVSSGSTYRTATVALEPGSTVLLFTDGVFERRGETVDEGLERLRSACAVPSLSLSDLVDSALVRLATGAASDDAAILAVRWVPQTTTPQPSPPPSRRAS